MNRWLSILAIVLSIAAIVLVLSNRAPDGAKVAAIVIPADRDEERAEAPQQNGDVALRLRLGTMEMTVASLVRRVSALEKAPAAKPGEPVTMKEEDRRQVERLRKEVDSLLTGEALASDAGRKRFKEVLRTVQDEVFAERMQDQMAALDKDRTDRLKKLADDARLTSDQQQQVAKLLNDESQQRRAIIDQLRSGQAQPGENRGAMRTLRQNTDEAARQVLDSSQYEKYQQMRQDERNAFRGGGPGGPPPPPP